jgi:hypothetical protein
MKSVHDDDNHLYAHDVDFHQRVSGMHSINDRASSMGLGMSSHPNMEHKNLFLAIPGHIISYRLSSPIGRMLPNGRSSAEKGRKDMICPGMAKRDFYGPC